MIKKKCVISILMAMTFLTSLYAQRGGGGVEPPAFERVGQTGWQFLHLPTVARNAALANIKSGLTNNDVSSIFSNPANLVDVSNIDATFSRINYVADISYMTVAVAKNFGKLGVFGFSFANLDIGDMIRTENRFNEDLGITERSGDLGTFSAGDILIGLSYARAVTDRLSIGGNFSYIQEKLDQTKVENWNADFGIFFRTGFHSLRLSILARNFGPDTEFTGFTEIYGLPQSVRMPLDFRFGIGYDFIEATNGSEHKLSGFLEGVHTNDGPERVHAAMEYTFLAVFSLRAGYKFNYDEQGLTLGGGINFNMKGMTGRIDYAYLDYGRLSAVHLFTIGFGFGE
ncbi:MAG: PorV/PorQ family protein [bacterium]